MYEKAIEEYKKGKSARQVARELNIGKDKLTNYLKQQGILRPKKDNSYNQHIFRYIDTEEKAYWLGFLYADGYISNNHIELTLAKQDREHLEKFKKFVQFKGDIKQRVTKLNGKEFISYRIRLFGTYIVNDLINHGCIRNKSLTLDFPTHLDTNLYKHFIRGYVDGDGSLIITNEEKPRVEICGNHNFLTKLQYHLIQECENLKEVQIYTDKRSKVFYYKKGGNQALLLYQYLYSNSTIYLYRKYSKFAHLKSDKIGEA